MNIRKRNEQNSDSKQERHFLALLLTKLAQESHLTSVRPSKNEMLPSGGINSRIRNNKDPWGNSLVVQGLGLHALTVKGGMTSLLRNPNPTSCPVKQKAKKRRKEIKILAHCLTHSKHTAGSNRQKLLLSWSF